MSIVTDEMADRAARSAFKRLWPRCDFDQDLDARARAAYRRASRQDLEAALGGLLEHEELAMEAVS